MGRIFLFTPRFAAFVATTFLFLIAVKDVLEITSWHRHKVVLTISLVLFSLHSALALLSFLGWFTKKLVYLKCWIIMFPVVMVLDISNDYFILREIYEGRSKWGAVISGKEQLSAISSTFNVITIFIAFIILCLFFDDIDSESAVTDDCSLDPWATRSHRHLRKPLEKIISGLKLRGRHHISGIRRQRKSFGPKRSRVPPTPEVPYPSTHQSRVHLAPCHTQQTAFTSSSPGGKSVHYLTSQSINSSPSAPHPETPSPPNQINSTSSSPSPWSPQPSSYPASPDYDDPGSASTTVLPQTDGKDLPPLSHTITSPSPSQPLFYPAPPDYDVPGSAPTEVLPLTDGKDLPPLSHTMTSSPSSPQPSSYPLPVGGSDSAPPAVTPPNPPGGGEELPPLSYTEPSSPSPYQQEATPASDQQDIASPSGEGQQESLPSHSEAESTNPQTDQHPESPPSI